ncbi:isochorismatase family cysteine hydrolase [Streptomyces sp. NPDC005485]|uniref:cysteine hydrolase family protein n=1 Tax=Streptomyces sp. NPDC005485 TaxID=3155591 RepID=UPI0033B958CE
MTAGTHPSDGLLAVIDMQRVFAEPDSPWATPRFDAAAAGVRRLLPVFGERVTFTRFVAPDKPAGIWRAYYEQWPFALRPPHSRLWELTDEFAARAPHVMDATTFGKWTPELAERVSAGGRLLLAGVSTDCCVLSTALAAADAGTEVWVVADACAGVDDDTHAAALRVMGLYGPHIRVVTVDDVLTEAGRTVIA